MNCLTFKTQLDESIENRVTIDSPEFEKHKKDCASCAELLQSSHTLDYVIDQWKKEEFNVNIVDRVLFHLNWSQSDSSSKQSVIRSKDEADIAFSSHRTHNKSSFAAISATALVLISSIIMIQSNRDDSQTVRLVSGHNRTISTDNNEKNMELDEIIFDVGSAYLALANNTADSFSGAVNIVSSRDKNGNEKNKTKQGSQYRWIKSLGNDLKPIQKDLGEAMDFLYESLPVDSPSTI